MPSWLQQGGIRSGTCVGKALACRTVRACSPESYRVHVPLERGRLIPARVSGRVAARWKTARTRNTLNQAGLARALVSNNSDLWQVEIELRAEQQVEQWGHSRV